MALTYLVEKTDMTQETLTKDGFTAQMTYHCLWSERSTARGLLRNSLYPHFPTLNLRCTNIVCKPLSNDGQNPNVVIPGASNTIMFYKIAELTCTYEPRQSVTRTAGTGSGETVSVKSTYDISGEFITVPPDGLSWKTSGRELTADEALGKRHSFTTWNYSMSGVENYDNDFDDLIDKVNDAPVYDPIKSEFYLAGTLLCTGVSPEFQDDGAGNESWNIDFSFVHRPNGWNAFFDPKTQTWDTIVDDTATDVVLFESADFSIIGF